jgi:hypothetical protein
MIENVTQKINQSAFDLCLQTYGTLDNIIKFAQDNGLPNLSTIKEQQTYQYDSDLVITGRVTGFIYATQYIQTGEAYNRIFSSEFDIVFA